MKLRLATALLALINKKKYKKISTLASSSKVIRRDYSL